LESGAFKLNKAVYYFSGTGNTLAVAREIAKKIHAEPIPLAAAMRAEKLHIDAQTIGVVFPSYLAMVYGMPLIVERFIRKIENIDSLHIFAVCTCGGYTPVNALPSLFRLEQLIRSCGGKLSAAYSVRLPMNNLDYGHIPIPIETDSETIIQNSKGAIDFVCNDILKGKPTKHRLAKRTFPLLLTPLFLATKKPVLNMLKKQAKVPADANLAYAELVPLTDRSIVVNDDCTGCGICARVCPVGNIKITDGKPVFQHRCEMCFACDEWCPVNAVHHWSRKVGVKYRHPDVRLPDMLAHR